ASYAFKSAFNNANPQLLEPIYDVTVLCPSESMGDIMGDLQTRRAIIQGMGTEGHYQKINAKVPLAEMYKYCSSLRSLSQGRAKFTRTFAEYQNMIPSLQKKIINEAKSELVEA
ncbi:MAG: elongation factor G, partial [Saprospiraceae bacterium]|nr:elongation factor G [Bacteroidia bacterium]NNL91089.1 elongation factor G [Saprospiraceae bacterium]